jgi:ribonucleoside-triphosphate reductase
MGVNGDSCRSFEYPNPLSQFVITRSYCRWDDDLQRRETYPEAVDRYCDWIASRRDVPPQILEEIRSGILNMEVLPSMRALWSAGVAADSDNTMLYNCSFLPLDNLRAFAEMLHILMMGTGVGYSVESRFVSKLPNVLPSNGRIHRVVVADSTAGWSDSLFDVLTHLWKGYEVEVDYGLIRPEGSRCMTKGGRASGPGPLMKLIEFCKELISSARSDLRKLTTLEVNDIACMIGKIVKSGGVRSAALISFSDPEDQLMRHAKDWSRGEFPDYRYLANNSGFWDKRPDRKVFDDEWTSLRNSGSGERGFYMFPLSKRRYRSGECRSNPCGEILLRFKESSDPWTGEGGGGQFCNLSAAVMRSHDTVESFSRKVYLATWIGAIQASFTDFQYLRPAWKQHCEEDRLLGVDITGHCDNPRLSNDLEALSHFNSLANQTAREAAAHLGMNVPAMITCGKPSGTSSQAVDCASGFHHRWSKYYVRRVRISSSDPLFHLVRDAGAPVFKDVPYKHFPDSECPTWVVEFPVKSPDGCMVRDDETALQQLERYKTIMGTWLSHKGHNQSATIYVREDEWKGVGDWLYDNFDEVTGLSFLPYDGGRYELAPYETITEEEYTSRVERFPVIDYNLLSSYELEDMGTGSAELACMGGSCEIGDWSLTPAETSSTHEADSGSVEVFSK